MHAAVPEAGALHTPLIGNSTRVAFRIPGAEFPIPLTDMGTGIQHLVMMAVIFETTGANTPVSVEEPDTHLHPGAQRFLLEAFKRDSRQVFLTTHSPVFAVPDESTSVHRVTRENNRTRADRVIAAPDRARLLEMLGTRYSDVLLSDAVLFVEGESDRLILLEWARACAASCRSRQ